MTDSHLAAAQQNPAVLRRRLDQLAAELASLAATAQDDEASRARYHAALAQFQAVTRALRGDEHARDSAPVLSGAEAS